MNKSQLINDAVMVAESTVEMNPYKVRLTNALKSILPHQAKADHPLISAVMNFSRMGFIDTVIKSLEIQERCMKLSKMTNGRYMAEFSMNEKSMRIYPSRNQLDHVHVSPDLLVTFHQDIESVFVAIKSLSGLLPIRGSDARPITPLLYVLGLDNKETGSKFWSWGKIGFGSSFIEGVMYELDGVSYFPQHGKFWDGKSVASYTDTEWEMTTSELMTLL